MEKVLRLNPKSKAKATPKGKGKGKSGKGSGGKGKGKMYEVGDEQSWEETGEQGEYTEEPDGETGGESLAMPLLGGCLSEPCECEFDLVLGGVHDVRVNESVEPFFWIDVSCC